MPRQAGRQGAEVRQCKYARRTPSAGLPNVQTISTVYSSMLGPVPRVICDL